jgi:hypothetical protein
MRYVIGLNLMNYGEIMKYYGYKKFMLQANKFNKHPIFMVNVIECFILLYIYIYIKNYNSNYIHQVLFV